MKSLFDSLSIECSRLTTRAYSTSFCAAIGCLGRRLRDPVHSVYGFVRFADEIVDSFHDHDRGDLLARFRAATFKSISQGISLNPILNSFQATVKHYGIELQLIEQFLDSMEMDLRLTTFDSPALEKYIFGSAEAVGLMCLRIFTKEDKEKYERLKPYAMRLGAAFQKVNFLRDLRQDHDRLGRVYFQGMDPDTFDEARKAEIEESISADFRDGAKGIQALPRSSRFGVYVAYAYYLALFNKMRNMSPKKIMNERIRIRGRQKATLLAYSFVKHQLNLI